MQLIAMTMAGTGGRPVWINPEHVVCIFDMGEGRTQVVTTGLQGETSITLTVDMAPSEVARRLMTPEAWQELPSSKARAIAGR